MNNLEILFFYNRYNLESIRTKAKFSEVLKHETKIPNLKLRNIDVVKDASISKFYEVKGVPTVIILKNKAIHARVLGEISETEIRMLLKESNKKLK